MKRIWMYLKMYKKECVLAPLFKMLEATFELFVPLVVSAIIDVGIAGADKGYIVKMCFVLVALAIIGLTSSITAQYFAAKAAVGCSTQMRHHLFKHIQSLSFTEMDTIGTSTLITRMTSDINQVQNGVNLVLRLFLRSPFIVFGAMIMAFTIDVKAALVFVGAIPILAVIVFGIMLSTRPLYKKVQAGLDKILGITRENLTGVRVIRAFNKENEEVDRFKKSNEELNHLQKFVGKISGLMNPLTYAVVNISIILLIWIGAVRVNSGTLTQGQVVALYNYMSQILVELIKLANLVINITKALACANRIDGIFAVKSSMADGKLDISETGKNTQVPAVEFKNVSFKYDENGKTIIKNFSADVKSGQKIAIVGPTGAGKTTMVNLLMKFYDINKGEILIDGVSTKDLTRGNIHDLFTMVLQDTWVFNGSIKDNIIYNTSDVSMEMVESVCKTVGLDHFIKTLPDGYNTILNDNDSVSAGQRQLLTIARGMIQNAPFLILDEATSNVDTRTEELVQKAMDKLTEGKTSFIIAHRLSTIKNADLILVMNEGNIIEQGNHEELMKQNGFYAELYNSQFKL